MEFRSPIWLALLVPWVGFSAWLLWGRNPRTSVPFLELWRGPAPSPRRQRQLTIPWHILAGMMAMLLVVIAAAQPALRSRQSAEVPTTTRSDHPRENVAIIHAAAREFPRSQAMVTLANASSLSSTVLNVQSARHEVALPPRGKPRSYFFDLSGSANQIEIVLDLHDDVVSDNLARLTRTQAWPRVEVRSPLPPEVARVIDAYSMARPAGDGGRKVVVDTGSVDGAGVIVATGAETTEAGVVALSPHPVTASLDFGQAQVKPLGIAPLGEGWSAIATVAGKPIISVRQSPSRQAWVGFGAADVARTAMFVVLWSNLLDWVGEGGDYGYMATLAPAPVTPKTPSDLRPASEGVPVNGWVLLGSILCLLSMVLCWPAGPNLTAFSKPRTV